jgi:hypothetical protein
MNANIAGENMANAIGMITAIEFVSNFGSVNKAIDITHVIARTRTEYNTT